VFIDGLCKEGKLDEATKLFSEIAGRNILMVYVMKASWLRWGSSSLKCQRKTYALTFSHAMHLSMVYVRKGNGKRPPEYFTRC